jgi:hypothetical protein
MFYPKNSIKKLFFCKSGGWTSVINAEDAAEAVTQAMTEALEHFATTDQSNFVVGSAIMCQEINEDLENAKFFHSSAILANAGFHDLAKDLESINE